MWYYNTDPRIFLNNPYHGDTKPVGRTPACHSQEELLQQGRPDACWGKTHDHGSPVALQFFLLHEISESGLR